MRRIDINSVIPEPVSHDPQIEKQVFLRNGDFGPVTQVARASFPPGSCAALHQHFDMGELFLVEKGKGTFNDGDTLTPLYPGLWLAVPPQQPHEIINTGNTSLVISVIGVCFSTGRDE